MVVTLETIQLPIGWLKASRPRNQIDHSEAPHGRLKAVTARNKADKSVTLVTYATLASWMKAPEQLAHRKYRSKAAPTQQQQRA